MATLTNAFIEARFLQHQVWQEERERKVEAVLTDFSKSSFENYAAALGIPERQWVKSKALREWARQNADRLYVPEFLLNRWGIRPSV